jgi:cob(I)alamin adenosyltransferase
MKKNIKKQVRGLTVVYTGNGKGKTTAAIGMAFRAAGWEQKVAIIQFIKGYKNTGEWKIIQKIPNVSIFQTFQDKRLIIGEPREEHKKSVFEALNLAKKMIGDNQHDLLILDEINNAIHYGLVEVEEIIKMIKQKPVEMTLVFTGRNAPKEILDMADLVTEMKEIKHPYQKNIAAKKGIDY